MIYCRSVLESDKVSWRNGGSILPKETFFNLPAEKQETLIKAAQAEFSRVPLNEASIANILKHAQIPRGSFYQYFADKEDAFFYLLELGTKLSRDKFLEYLQQADGDLATAFIELFKQLLLDFKEEENRLFFRNIFLNMNYKTEYFFTKEMNFDNDFSNVKNVVDTTHLNTTEESEIIHIAKIFGTITLWHIVQSFAKERSYDESIHYFIKDINLLKHGLYKNT